MSHFCNELRHVDTAVEHYCNAVAGVARLHTQQGRPTIPSVELVFPPEAFKSEETITEHFDEVFTRNYMGIFDYPLFTKSKFKAYLPSHDPLTKPVFPPKATAVPRPFVDLQPGMPPPPPFPPVERTTMAPTVSSDSLGTAVRPSSVQPTRSRSPARGDRASSDTHRGAPSQRAPRPSSRPRSAPSPPRMTPAQISNALRPPIARRPRNLSKGPRFENPAKTPQHYYDRMVANNISIPADSLVAQLGFTLWKVATYVGAFKYDSTGNMRPYHGPADAGGVGQRLSVACYTCAKQYDTNERFVANYVKHLPRNRPFLDMWCEECLQPLEMLDAGRMASDTREFSWKFWKGHMDHREYEKIKQAQWQPHRSTRRRVYERPRNDGSFHSAHSHVQDRSHLTQDSYHQQSWDSFGTGGSTSSRDHRNTEG